MHNIKRLDYIMPATEITKSMRDRYCQDRHIAITITLKPLMYKMKPNKQLGSSLTTVLDRLKELNLFELYPELTKSDNLHYHGYICTYLDFDEIKLDIHNVFRDTKNIGFVDVKLLKEFEDRERWFQYISKDVNKSIKFIGATHIKDICGICSCKYSLLCLPYKSIYLD